MCSTRGRLSRIIYGASGVMAPLSPTYKRNVEFKGDVDSIGYHVFVINLPAIHRDRLEKKKTHSHQGI